MNSRGQPGGLSTSWADPRRWLPALVFALGAAAGCGGSDSETLSVFAAASTTDVMTEIAAAFTAEFDTPVRCNFASSSALARQIDQGAEAEVYLSANEKWMDWLESRGRVAAADRCDLLANRLVVVASPEAGIRVRFDPGWDLAGSFAGLLALGDPTHVPAGIYARQALESYGWYAPLEGRLATALNVRAALRLVETGTAELGIVYATDAAASKAVAVVGEVPEGAHDPIRYPAAVLGDAGPGARAFLDFLRSPAAAAIFRSYGFTVLEGEGR